MLLQRTDGHPLLVIVATPIIVFMHVCGYYSRAATNRGAAFINTIMQVIEVKSHNIGGGTHRALELKPSQYLGPTIPF